MKINTEIFHIKNTKEDQKAAKNTVKNEKHEPEGDRVTLSSDRLNEISKENKASSVSNLTDVQKAEEEIAQLREKLSGDHDTASRTHNLNIKSDIFQSIS